MTSGRSAFLQACLKSPGHSLWTRGVRCNGTPKLASAFWRAPPRITDSLKVRSFNWCRLSAVVLNLKPCLLCHCLLWRVPELSYSFGSGAHAELFEYVTYMDLDRRGRDKQPCRYLLIT